MSRGGGKPGLIGKSLYVGNYYVTVQKKLGEGGFADIYQVVDRNDHSAFYALKHFRICGDPEKLASVKRECLLMKSIKKHQNIVTLFAACFAGTPVATDGFFLMELCHQDLVKALTANHRHMTEADILRIFQQVALGLSYMHTQTPPVAHWDLKAENILQSLNGSWVVCDFGSATTMNEVVDPSRVADVEDIVRRNTTAAYRAPEALGVLLYLMCFSQFPFQADDKLSVIRGKYPMPPSQHRPATRALIAQMLCVDPAQRPDIHAVVATVKSLLEGGIPTPAASSTASSHPSAAPPVPRPLSQPGSGLPAPAPNVNMVPPTPPTAASPHMHGHPNHAVHAPPQHHPQVAVPPQARAAYPALPVQHTPPPGAQPASAAGLQANPHYAPQQVVQQQHPGSHPGTVQQHPTPLPVPVTAAAASAANGIAAPAAYANMPHLQQQQQPVSEAQRAQAAAAVPSKAHFDPFTMNAAASSQRSTADSAAAYDPYAPPRPQSPPDPFGQTAESTLPPAVPQAPEAAAAAVQQAPPALATASGEGYSAHSSGLSSVETGPPAPLKCVAVPTAKSSQLQPPPRTESPLQSPRLPPPGTAPTPPSTSTSNQLDQSPRSHPLVKATTSRPESPQRPPGAPPLPIPAHPFESEIQPAPPAHSVQHPAAMKASLYAQGSSGGSCIHAPPQVATRAAGGLGRVGVGQDRSSAPGSLAITAPASPSMHARAASGSALLTQGPKLVSAAMFADSTSLEAQSSEFPLPTAQPARLAASNPRTNAQIAAASASASAYAYAATGADSSDDEDAWGQPSAAEAAAAYVGNAMQSHGTSLRADSAAVAPIEDTEAELLQLRGQAKVAEQDKNRLEQKLGEVMSELDQRRLQVAELRSVVEALAKPGASLKHAGTSSNGAGLAAGAAQQDLEGTLALGSARNGTASARVHAAMQSGGKGVVPARVVAVLNETADAASRQGGLQRSVSEVHLDWENIKEAPLRNDAWIP